MDAIARNWHDLELRIARAAERAGRQPDGVEVVAVTKTRSAEEVDAAICAGLRHVGENRVQEAAAKRPGVRGEARWHLVGSLQRNKAGGAVELFDMVQSVDSARLADALDRRAAGRGRRLDVLLQVNTSGAPQQGGLPAALVPALVVHVAALPHLRVRGLMTIADHGVGEARVRACFRQLRELAGRVEASGPPGIDLSVLSMGMSGDFELAIEEGSTMIRVGTAIFGPRS